MGGLAPAYQDAIALRDQGRFAEAEARLRAHLALHPQDRTAEMTFQALLLMQGRPPPAANAAIALGQARAMAEMRGPPVLQGADEGPRLQRAVELVLEVLPDLPPEGRPVAAHILWRAGHYDAAAALGDLAELGRQAARQGAGRSLLHQLARIETGADRLEAVSQHQLWAKPLEEAAAARPISRPPRRAPRDRLRLGFLSSDLRHHVVAFFVQPLFQFIDSRFELFVYSSFPGPADAMEQWMAGRARAYRRLPADDRDAAQMIADDDLDLLLELGGPTAHNRPGVVAYRPAPLQASWLGYPHSLGLSAIDRYIGDPHMLPTRPDLLLERPLTMPSCWITMAPAAFPPQLVLEPVPPAVRNGYVTFGTANDPYKYAPRMLTAWARVMAQVPGSRFLFIRPEGGAPVFRENIARYFAAEGVSVDRLDFRAVRGAIRPLYNQIDIALDTFPLTGGTSTCEALWMGVPTVTLVGEAPYERLSWSILSNAGLSELGSTTLDAYVETAVRVAGDLPRLAEMRGGMRERIASQPLGQPMQFAADFYDLLAEAIAGRA